MLQKFCNMICEIIFSRVVCGMFLIFLLFTFDKNFVARNNFLELQNSKNLIIRKPIYFLKIYAHRFEDLICTNKLKGLFSRIFFSMSWNVFHDCKITHSYRFFCFVFVFFAQKNNFILFFKCDYLILTQY